MFTVAAGTMPASDPIMLSREGVVPSLSNPHFRREELIKDSRLVGTPGGSTQFAENILRERLIKTSLPD
jgi:hypothetical protein